MDYIFDKKSFETKRNHLLKLLEIMNSRTIHFDDFFKNYTELLSIKDEISLDITKNLNEINVVKTSSLNEIDKKYIEKAEKLLLETKQMIKNIDDEITNTLENSIKKKTTTN